MEENTITCCFRCPFWAEKYDLDKDGTAHYEDTCFYDRISVPRGRNQPACHIFYGKPVEGEGDTE